MGFLATPLGWIMKLCYELVGNYGIALLIFTLITRLVVFPLNIKQQKSTAKMSMLQPELQKLQKKYKNNKEKLNEETMKLYSKENANPMASCLPMIITLVILWSLIPVVYGPLTYVSEANKDNVASTNTLITEIYTLSSDVKEQKTNFDAIIKEVGEDNAKLKEEFKKEKYKGINKMDPSGDEWTKIIEAVKKDPSIGEFITDPNKVSENLVKSRPELVIFDIVKKEEGKHAVIIPDDYKDVRVAAEDFDYEFLGLSLGTIPKWGFNLTVLIPILSAVLQLLTTIISQRFTKKNNPAAAQMGGSMKIMLYAMPLFSLWIGFSFPAGLGLYWIYSSLFSVIQVIVLNVIYTPEKVKAMVEKDKAKAKKKNKQSFMERAMAAQNQQNGNANSNSSTNDNEEEFDEDRKLSKAEAKELQRKRLNEARRRMAEKYGDEYSDD